MEENIRLELYSALEVKQWLQTGVSVRGLSSELIDKQRAYAIVNNPYVTDGLYIISALFVEDEIGAYTYLFPDKLTLYPNTEKEEEKLIYWNTTLYCNPKFEGRGYAYIVIGQFCELYGEDYFDLDAVPESIENLKFAGLNVEFIDQYVLSRKEIKNSSIKGKIARQIENLKGKLFSRRKSFINEIKKRNYKLEYVDFIDDALYQFIIKNRNKDLFLRSKAMLDWILKYNFMRSCPIIERIEDKCIFSSNKKEFQFYAVKVFSDDKLVGFYILSNSDEILYISYIYCDNESKEDVFYSIGEHLLKFNRKKFFTSNKDLWEFLKKYNLYSKSYIFKKSFSYPSSFEYNKEYNIHAGDGDNIT